MKNSILCVNIQVFYGENEKKTGQKNFEPWIFEQVPARNLNFEEDQINRAHGS